MNPLRFLNLNVLSESLTLCYVNSNELIPLNDRPIRLCKLPGCVLVVVYVVLHILRKNYTSKITTEQ